MSQNIIGMPKKAVFKNISKQRSEIKYDDVSVDIKSWYNRPTEYRTLKKYLKDGYQEALWIRPSVAELPNGDRYLFDGDHRRHMYKLAHPSAKTMPARIVQVKTTGEISDLFVQVNKTNTKTLIPSQTFFHTANGTKKNKQAVDKTVNFLDAAKLCVSMKTGEPGAFVGSSAGFYTDSPVGTHVGRFTKLIKMVDSKKAPIVHSSKIVQSLFTCEHELGIQICGQLLSGMALVFHNTKLSPDHHLYDSFVTFLESHKKHVLKQKTFSTSFKDAGYAISNNTEKSIALGIMKLFAVNTPEKASEIKQLFGNYTQTLEKVLFKGS